MPICYAIYKMLFDADHLSRQHGTLRVLCNCLYSLLNGVLTVLFVAPFRRFTTDKLRRAWAFTSRRASFAHQPVSSSTDENE